jgi:CubicO group peptidase (beta-lactamase class C family)
MSAHIAFPALTGDSIPATLNPRLMDGLLRRELGFNGLIVTDAMDMGAIVRRYGNTVAPVMALRAGADVLLQVMPSDVSLVIDAIVAAVQRGELTEARIDQSVRRLLEAKMRLGLHRRRTVDLAKVPQSLGTREHLARADEAAERSITVARDRDGVLPLRARRVLSIVYAGDIDPFAGRTFQRALAEKIPGLLTATLEPWAETGRLDGVRALAREADVVIFAPFIRVTAGKTDLAVAQPVGMLINEISAARPVIVTTFGNPYVLSQFPDVSTYVIAWGQWEAPQRAAAKALTGQIAITGRLPISIPPFYVMGDGVWLDRAGAPSPSSPLHHAVVDAPPRMPAVAFGDAGLDPDLREQVDETVRVALQEGAAPGAAVAIGRHGRLVHLAGYGRLDLREGFAAVTDSTLYDLASLTKVLATTTAVMMLVEEGKLELDAPVRYYLPEWGGSPAKDRITVRNLLLHDAGFMAYSALFTQVRGRRAYLQRIASLPLEYEPGSRSVYSDFGPILLGFIIERITGKPLDVFAQERIFGPLGMRDTGYNPMEWVGSSNGNGNGSDGGEDAWAVLRARIAPSERDTLWRMRHEQGNVHDENAYALGGVSGHAGLFSSVRDLAVFAQLMLNGGTYGGKRLVRDETVRAFTRRYSDESSRALGWDTPAPRSSAGDYFSSSSFGHTGFTGTSIWIDPERDVFLILLTNRVNPSRNNQRHVQLRRDLADAVQLAIRDMTVIPRPERD